MAPKPAPKKAIVTSKAPKPVGPYSQAVQIGDTVFVSGVLGLNKDTLKLVEGGAGPEAEQALLNLGHILDAADSYYANVVKTTVFLADMDDFPTVNEVYKKYFEEPYPARSCFQVAKLPLGAKVEIEAIAVSGNVRDVKPGLSA
ncbi:2-iminobutanoate/2-iminopropanoate deaminase-like isoform X2 [Macrosteles quadrilineatus]|uniref:2-iminobutanoate/2-iminopropanoate deaminase-like isoform X2 n=1 Tax=Macrosteles quadrilineatus TaxID=74068 RepID=UPI0023E2AD2F|nr:2-iminobutanoate/2-iminopropanoate deaminase-like isoform X2 [Macrosteles quadrilineatus]